MQGCVPRGRHHPSRVTGFLGAGGEPWRRFRFSATCFRTISDRGRDLIGIGRGDLAARANAQELIKLCEDLISRRGEASGVALARLILERYSSLAKPERLVFLQGVATVFGADHEAVDDAIAAYRRDPTRAALGVLHVAAEPRSQELIRRLNLARNGTLALVRMREDLFALRKELRGSEADHDLIDAVDSLDSDFEHLFASWFNRGFLVLRHIDWTTPAHILEKIIRYEAVHEIAGWDELRRRIEPSDRRCFAFFHPALQDEPLIFVEVALTGGIAPAIAPILAHERELLPTRAATTAIFYSISNCQKGLAGITFGNFLIKQVVEDLAREIPSLKTFVTLSPVPGFSAWLDRERRSDSPQGLTRGRYRGVAGHRRAGLARRQGQGRCGEEGPHPGGRRLFSSARRTSAASPSTRWRASISAMARGWSG